MLKPLIFACSLLGIIAPNFAKAECEQLLAQSKRVAYFQKVVDREQKLPRSWFNHKLSDEPLIVMDTDASPSCAAFWRPATGWSTLDLGIVVKMNRDSTYGSVFRNQRVQSDEATQLILDALLKLTEESNVGVVYYWIWGAETKPSLPPGMAKYKNQLPKRIVSDLGVAIHEAFHYIVQRPESGKRWTSFSGSVSDEDLYKCYIGTPEIREIHRREMDAILKAFVTADRQSKLQAVREFLSLRRERNQIFPTGTTKNWSTGKVETFGCADQEARQELGEGVPQFTGNALMLDLGLASKKQIATEIFLTTKYYLDQTTLEENVRPINSYYHSGSVSLLLIRELYDGNFLKLTEDISQPEAKIVVTDLLEQVALKAAR